MNSDPKLKNLELSVTNFGPIVEANIDLRPMTVFVGPSNTGKSYLAILIYALHKFFEVNALDVGFGNRPTRTGAFFGRQILGRVRPLPDEDREILATWIEDMLPKFYDTGWPQDRLLELPKPVARLVRRRLSDPAGYARLLAGEIARCFGIEDIGNLIRHGSRDGLSVRVGRPVPTTRPDAATFAYKYTFMDGSSDLSSSIPSEDPVRVRSSMYDRFGLFDIAPPSVLMGRMDEDDKSYILASLFRLLVVEYGSFNLSPLVRTPYYLPASRTGVMHAHRVVVSSLIERAPITALGSKSHLPDISGVLADFLRILFELREGPRSKSRLRDENDLAWPLEQGILNGAILIRDSMMGFPEFLYRPDGWRKDLPLMNTSSMVSELAPVVLYLRHVVKPGDVLIIEEPESHLHPAMQVEFIRHLAAAVHAGVRVMLTTHSEWVLDELANLVHLSNLPESDREGIGGGDYALSPDEVGVWLFESKKRPKGAKVREIPFRGEYGGFASDFERVAMGTYNDFAGISNRIEHRRPK